MKSRFLFVKRAAIIPTIASLLLAAAPVGAQAPERVSASANGRATVSVPQAALDNAPVIVPLGEAVDPNTGRIVEGIAIIHYRKGHAKPDNPGNGKGNGGGGGGGDDTSSCYSYLAKGAYWKTVEDYVVDPSNTRGLSDVSIRAITAGGIDQWEDAADGAIDGSVVDIFGNEDLSLTVDRAAIGDLDGQNDVMFADIAESGVIGVTYVWGIFGGPPHGRELVEWNMVYDDVDFDWSLTGEAGKMDLENIVVHELGHALGMGHTDLACTEETMYPYADLGETKKRDLEAGDIAGIDGLY